MFSVTLRKVKAIPPPMIISSTLSSMFSINWILSATLALEQNQNYVYGETFKEKIIHNEEMELPCFSVSRKVEWKAGPYQ